MNGGRGGIFSTEISKSLTAAPRRDENLREMARARRAGVFSMEVRAGLDFFPHNLLC